MTMMRSNSLSLPLLAALLLLLLLLPERASAHDVVLSLEDDLDYDGNGKLSTHQLVYTEGCAGDLTATIVPDRFEFHPVAGKAQIDLFGAESAGECRAACLERGVDRTLVAAVLPQRQYSPADDGTLVNWLRDGCTRVEVCVLNYVDESDPLMLYWLHPTSGEKKFHMSLEYGERKTRCFSSFIGHQFVVERKGEDGDGGAEASAVVGEFAVEFTTVLAFGKAPTLVKPDQDKSQQIRSTLKHEWDRHIRVTRTFSPLGFAKGRLPDDVFASMAALYYNNRHHKVNEEWKGKGVFVNWWEADVSFIQIPWGLKSLWQRRLKDLVEAWAGVPIEQTDMYGLRQYEAGARLLTHVDRERTHGVSLIVNVAQGNLTEPWPVEVHDHRDRLHEVIMQPGDVVYYESAKCLHGRNRPLTGPDAYYVNLFTHYRPIGDDEWFTRPNHEGAPDPVLETKGECRLEAQGTAQVPSSTTAGQLGIVQAVTCDDPRLGPYLSPALFTATSGDDLFDWWVKVGPNKAAAAKTAATVKDEL